MADKGKGFFITFEGGEGSGKSTQARLLGELLRSAGLSVLLTREPGGTDMAERIRSLLVCGEPEALSSTAEALLNYAARDDHLRRRIRPALRQGRVVISDRFMDSTRAYQALAGDCPQRLVDALERDVVGETVPDLTFIMDIDPETGLARAGGRLARDARQVAETPEMAHHRSSPEVTGAGSTGCEDRFERFGLAFHQRLREAYLTIARAQPHRCVVIDAARSVEAVAEDIARIATQRLQQSGVLQTA